MKTIAIVLVAIALMGMASAMPTDMMNNTEVCKIGLDTGNSFLGFFAWQNPATDIWEVVLGMTTYKGVTVIPKVYYGDEMGNVLVDLT